VYTTTASHSTTSCAPQGVSLPETMASDITGCASPAVNSYATAGYDPILLVAALEEIDARRAAIEWLLDANVLCLCLV
jgi:hypothetical protein